ncbi:MAG TPA: DNA polymerase III subunit gamma/tau [Chitinophagales bacterium]|nr:DNA polymerase III subunit gamma/tau [Chitinophagales bacterium]
MSFVVSARKYRPQQFKDVVGQKSVTNTLKNAIKSGKLAHSFLFCGPRGVGKTTCARILAKLLNCQTPTADAEPCGTCASCLAFAQSASFNIFELDAASNNSVDDIRSLIEQVRFAPQSGKYKIYIIDEVHMLSQAAFNAFLKTLEEPPSYAIFILATTEKHKIIPTILSRCQIYDFNRITVQDMVEHLQDIAQDQGITAEPDALHIIAQKADGGLRDALSMFDRIAGYAQGNLRYEHVLEALNVLDYDYFFKATDYLLAQDASGLLLLFDEVLRKGFEGDNFINGLSAHFRNLLVCKDQATLTLLDVTEGLKERYRTQALLAPMALLLSLLNLANECEIQYKTSKNKRLQVELSLLKMCYATNALHFSQNPNGGGSIALQANTGLTALTLKQAPQTGTQEKKNDAANLNAQQQQQVKEEPAKYKPAGTVKLNLNQLSNLTKDQTPKANDNNILPDENPTDLPETQLVTPAVLPDENAVRQYWQQYVAAMNAGYAKTMMEQVVIGVSGFTITITIASEYQRELLKDEIPQFLNRLYSQTGCREYKAAWVINKEQAADTQKKMPAYMPNEQLKEMIATNPKLNDLIKRLQLQLS